jgi:hypothetical protein
VPGLQEESTEPCLILSSRASGVFKIAQTCGVGQPIIDPNCGPDAWMVSFGHLVQLRHLPLCNRVAQPILMRRLMAKAGSIYRVYSKVSEF